MNALANDLNPGFQILWYQIHSVLGRGGFGITYLAEDTNLGQMVAIKEYLPQEYASRSNDSTVQPISIDHDDVYAWGLERFMSEAQTLAKFEHDNIVRILSVFKENNTGYMVMKYEQGRDLSDIYEDKQQLTQTELEQIYLPIMDGLKIVHAGGFIHRDIKPSNIYIRDNGSPVLLDFGAARHAVGSKTRTLTAMLSVGYAPFEQYNENSGKQGPWTDIYALGASMYQGITGEKPLESTMRGMAFVHNEPDPYHPLSFTKRPNFSTVFLRAIDASLMLQINDRPQTIDEFVAMLRGDVSLTRLQPGRYAKSHPSKTVIRPGNKDGSLDQDAPHNSDLSGQSTMYLEGNEKEKEAPRRSESKKGYVKLISIIVGLVIAALVGYMLVPTELSPEEKREQQTTLLLKEAERYFEAGDFFGQGRDNALSTYREVLSINPANTAAIEGLNNIGAFYLQSARDAIEQKNFDAAETRLKIVRSINSDFPGLKDIQENLSSALDNEKLLKQVSMYLAEAKKALDGEHIYDPVEKSAYSYFNKVLELDSNSVEANNGLELVTLSIVNDAKKALSQGKLKKADSLIALAERIKPETPGIRDIRKQLSATSNVEKLIARADSAYARQQFTTPKSENAVELYGKVIKLSPGNSHATEMLKKIADFYAIKVRNDIRKEKFESAKSVLKILASNFPGHSGNAVLKQELSTAKNRKELLESIRYLLPVGIKQNQSGDKIIEDILGKFISAFKQKNISRLKNVAQLDSQLELFFTQVFDLYKNFDVDVVASSSQSSQASSKAEIKLKIVGLVDQGGNQVESDASWTRIQLGLVKKNGYWYKANLGSW